MLTPIDIQNHSLKTAVRGYSKKETDDFLEEILEGYEELYKENRELKDKITSLSEGIQYYKQMETTLQKALVLAEKTSTETQEAAKSKAESMVSEAQAKAEAILKEAEAESDAMRKEIQAYSDITKSKANRELEDTRNHVRKLVQSYENYRLQFKKLAESQIEMLESEHYSIFAPELSEMLDDAPDADAVMDADRNIPINAKNDYYDEGTEDSENISESQPVLGFSWEDTEPAEDGDAVEELVAKTSEADDESDSEDVAQEDKDLKEIEPEKDKASDEAEDVSDKVSNKTEDETDIDSKESGNASEKSSRDLEEEARAKAMAKIKIPDMEITADTIVPGVVLSETEQTEKESESKDASDWENTTPKLDDYDAIEVSKTVSPNPKGESPFTFIDTE